MTPLSQEVVATLVVMFTVTIMVIVVATVTINGVICHMSRKLFKAMVYMQNRLLSPTELDEVYTMECKKHGFDEIK